MNYETLTESDLHAIARQRVRELEADHFHWRLREAECTDPTEASEIGIKLADLERRIAVHTVEEEPAQDKPPGDYTPPKIVESDTDGRGAPTTGDRSLDDAENDDR